MSKRLRSATLALALLTAFTVLARADHEAAAPSPATPAARVSARPTELPAGTAIYFQVDKLLSSDRLKSGDAFSGVVTRKVELNGRTIIPVGCSITGHVLRASSPRRIQGRPSIFLRPEEITFPDGEKLRISAAIVDTDTPRRLDVDQEGHIRGSGRSGNDNKEALIGTAAGAGTGALIGGGAGALVGAGAGATATTVHWLSKHHSVEIPLGTTLIAELRRPMQLAKRPHRPAAGD